MISSYLSLMRFDKPIGIVLLWFPVAWSLWIAGEGAPPTKITLLFLIGTILMRAAGCVINDIADRDFDKFVQRTQKRPVTTGEISLKNSLILFSILIMLAASILLFLPIECLFYAIGALIFTVIYPFCKRFIHTPQLVLGIAFSFGIPMAYAACNKSLDLTALLLVVANIIWVLIYDTIYALADKDDDLKIGLKSTAILFGSQVTTVLVSLTILLNIIWLIIAWINGFKMLFYICFMAAIIICVNSIYQSSKFNEHIKAFKLQSIYGLCLWVAIISELSLTDYLN